VLEYRYKNASAIAKHNTDKISVVSGPETGKSYLFFDEINHGFRHYSGSTVFAATLVRELVADLQSDIEDDGELSFEQKSRIVVSTLHKLARSIVERNFAISLRVIIFMRNY